VLLGSSEPYARAYDLDLLAELRADKRALDICYLSEEALAQDGQASLEEAWLTLPFIVYCQLLAFYKALELGVSPDNPCPSGQVNRVVQGVKLHSLAVYTRPGSLDNTED
jgi:tagatose-6-phosphate ketose/aldose isomerase